MSGPTRRLATIGVLGAVALLIGLPLVSLIATAAEDGPATALRATAAAGPSIVATLVTSVAATAMAVIGGTLLALATERGNIPGRRLLRLTLLLGLVAPGYVTAIGWQRVYGTAVNGPLGISVVLGVEALPLVYLLVAAALGGAHEIDIERAARAAGAGPWTALRTITLPLLGPTLAGAGAITFVLSVTAFGAPAVLGIPAGFTTMTTRIYRDLSFAADADAFARAIGLAIVLAVVTTVALAIAGRLLGQPARRSAGTTTSSLGSRPAVAGRPRPGALLAAGAAWLFVALTLLAPLCGLALTALTRAVGLPPTPDNWTLDNFGAALDRRALGAFGNSLLLAAAAALIAVLLALATLAVARGRARRALDASIGLTFALPGSTLAVGVLLAFGPLARNTLLIILVAYVAKLWLLAYRPLAAVFGSLALDLTRSARASGADALTAARTVSLPLLRPVIAGAAALIFVFALHELTMSSLLYGPRTATLAVVVLNLQQLGDPGPTAALAVIITLAVGALALPLRAMRAALVRGWWSA